MRGRALTHTCTDDKKTCDPVGCTRLFSKAADQHGYLICPLNRPAQFTHFRQRTCTPGVEAAETEDPLPSGRRSRPSSTPFSAPGRGATRRSRPSSTRPTTGTEKEGVMVAFISYGRLFVAEWMRSLISVSVFAGWHKPRPFCPSRAAGDDGLSFARRPPPNS